MKKLLAFLFFSLAAAVIVHGQAGGPVYVNDVLPFMPIGPFVVEYALGGSGEAIDVIKPFIHNNRLYFIGLALPVTSNNLRRGVEFNLDLFQDAPGIRAFYPRNISSRINSGHLQNGMIVSGFAMRGSITITDVFFDIESIENWSSSRRFAF